jgi:hypothetical protein
MPVILSGASIGMRTHAVQCNLKINPFANDMRRLRRGTPGGGSP